MSERFVSPPGNEPYDAPETVRVLYMEDDAGLARLFQKHLERAPHRRRRCASARRLSIPSSPTS